VEGVLDVHILRAHGIRSVAALGGSTITPDLFQRLADHGVERVLLALDNDAAGCAALVRAIDATVHAQRSPSVWIIDPDLYDTAKDPGDVIRTGGAEAWRAATHCSDLRDHLARPRSHRPDRLQQSPPRPPRRTQPRRNVARHPPGPPPSNKPPRSTRSATSSASTSALSDARSAPSTGANCQHAPRRPGVTLVC
jgi:DNA primase